MTQSIRRIAIGELYAATAPTRLVSLALGSCVAIVLHDSRVAVGGMAHVLLPTPGSGTAELRPGRVVTTAVPALVEAVTALGADPDNLTAKLVGGARMFANLAVPGTLPMGQRNLTAARAELRQLGIPIIAEACGGDYGRNVDYDIAAGTVKVTSFAHDDELI